MVNWLYIFLLQRRQEDLDRRAQDLERREQELRNTPYNGDPSSKMDQSVTSNKLALLRFSSSGEQLAAGAVVLPFPALLLPGHQRGHSCRVPEDRDLPLLSVGR